MDINAEKRQITKRSALLFGLVLFVANLVGFTIFRCSISSDLFGGDIYSFTRNTDSYSLAYRDILKPDELFQSLLSGKDAAPETNPSAFVWSCLSDQGRGAVERLASGGGTDWDKKLFIIALNKTLIDVPVNWPRALLAGVNGDLLKKQGMPVKEYNVYVLASLFPQISAPTHLAKISLRSLAKSTWSYLPQLFTLNQPTRYAPLSAFYSTALNNYLRNAPERMLSAVMIQASIYALLMTLVFFLALQVLASIPWAFFSVALFQTAVSTILSTYTLFCLPYFFVPLIMVAAFLSYLSYKSSGRKRYLIGFILLAIAGPWFREFAGLIPYVVLVNEVLNFQKKRSIVLMGICVLLCAHSIYPSFLTWLIGLNKGEFFSVYAQNNRQQLVTSVWNWMSPGMLFVEIPPILWLTAWISMGLWILRSKGAEGVREPTLMGIKFSRALFPGPKARKVLKGAVVILMILVPWLVAHYFFGQYRDPQWQHPGMGSALGKSVLAVILCLALFSLRFNTLIPVYFLAVFLPFMRIGGNTEVHLSFALAPLSMMILLWVKKLYEMLASGVKNLGRILCFAVLSFFFALGMIDQAANVWACMSSQRAAVQVNKKIADWIRTNLERHSVVLCNFFNFYDVFYYSDHYFDPYETVENCPMGPANVVHTDQDFNRLAENYFSLTPFYFLANRIPYYDYQKNYHSHKFVNNPPGTLEELHRFKLENSYYYFDPLKFFIMRRFQTLPLYMDWSIDFYYNNTENMFQRVVSADYTLYRLKDLVKPTPDPEKKQKISAVPPMLVTDHNKYNIVYYDKVFYAVPQSLGPMDLTNEEDRSRPGILRAKSGEEAKNLIDQVSTPVLPPTAVSAPKSVRPPTLVIAHKRYNVVHYSGAFYIVPQSLGPLDLVKEKDRTLPGIFVKDTLEEAQRLIDEIAAATPRTFEPPKLVKRYKKYNMVRYEDFFYALPQSLGPLDLARTEDRVRPGILVGKNLEEVHRLINEAIAVKVSGQIPAQALDPAGPPMLVTEHRGYNIVFYAGVFYAVPQSLGPMDLAIDANRMRPEIVTGSSLKKAKRNIDKTLNAKLWGHLCQTLQKRLRSFLRWLNKGLGPL